jgi:hypothetical protein
VQNASWVQLLPVEGGPPDRVCAAVLFDGRPVGRVEYANFPELQVIYTLQIFPDAPPTVAGAALDILSQRIGAPDEPGTWIHLDIRDPRVLLWYQAGALGAGAVVTGIVGGAIHYHDRLRRFEAADIEAAAEAGAPEANAFVVTWSRDVGLLDEAERLDAAAVQRLLRASTPSARIGALKEMSVSERCDPALREKAYFYAIMDPSFEVRRFAATNMSGFFADVHYYADPALLFAHLADPMLSLQDFPELPVLPDGEVWDPRHARRNKRYCIFWAIARLLSYETDDEAWVATWERLYPMVWEHLEAEAAAWSPERDREIYRWAVGELEPGGDRFGIGSERPVSLFEVLRLAVLRQYLVEETSDPDHDRFHWLILMVHYVVPSRLSPFSVHMSPLSEDEGEPEPPTLVEQVLFSPCPGPTSLGFALPGHVWANWTTPSGVV